MKRVYEKIKKNKLEIMCGLLSIIVGACFAFFVKGREVSSIQGYLYNGFGSATDSNATNSNVYQSATDSNATNSNAFNYDNYIYLSSFNFNKTEAKANDKVYVNLSTFGSNLYGATVVLKNPKTGASISLKVQDISTGPYVLIPSNITTANYIIKEVLLTGMNSNGTTFSRRFVNSLDSSSYGSDTFFMNFLNNLYIEGEKITTVELKSFSLLKNTCSTGEDVKIKYETTEKIDKMSLIFKSKDGKKVVGYVKDVNDSPYFKVSTLVNDGVYNLDSVTIGIDGKEVTYSKDKTGDKILSFDVSLEVKDGDKEKLVFNSEDINNIAIDKIENSNEESKIIINADNNTIIDERIFEKIKGTNKTLTINYGENEFVFKGLDIKNPKAIDVSLSINDISANKKISSLIGNGIILSFADNGTLPGVENVKIKSVGIVKKILSDNNIYVYLFNSDTSDFTLIKENVSKKGDYYEFELDHNSDYVLTTSKIEESLVVRKPEIDTVVFQKSNKVHFILIGVGVALIILLIIVLILIKRKNKNNDIDSNDLDTKKEELENTIELKKE